MLFNFCKIYYKGKEKKKKHGKTWIFFMLFSFIKRYNNLETHPVLIYPVCVNMVQEIFLSRVKLLEIFTLREFVPVSWTIEIKMASRATVSPRVHFMFIRHCTPVTNRFAGYYPC